LLTDEARENKIFYVLYVN